MNGTAEVELSEKKGNIPFLSSEKPTQAANDMNALNGKGIRNLVIAIVQQAVDDVKALTQAGVVQNGRIVMSTMPRKVCEGMTIPEVKDTLYFFEDANISRYLSLGGIDIEPKVIRSKLGFNW